MAAISMQEYLWNPSKYPAKKICVVFGNDAFLKFNAVQTIRQEVLQGDDAEFSFSRFEGKSLKLETLLKELATRAMFGAGVRLVMVEDADDFISLNRDALEEYFANPSKHSVLLLQCNSFASNQRIYKIAEKNALLINAKTCDDKEFPKWIANWSTHRYQRTCSSAAAQMIFERIGPEHGLIDQELSKLALMVAPKESITPELIEKNVGAWRTQTVFEMLSLALSGKTAEAIRQLDKLYLSGEQAGGIIGRISSTLHKFWIASELILDAEKNNKKITIASALEQAGVNYYFIKKTDAQLRMLGRHRGIKLIHSLLKTDLDMKGASRQDPRTVLEIFLISLSDPRLRTPKD